MNPGVRREQILQMLGAHDDVRVTRLAQRFGVSPGTIRADLEALEGAGLVQRHHGGASPADGLRRAAPAPQADASDARREDHIAARAASLVRPGDKLILVAGAATLQLARRLAQPQELPPASSRLTVFTNSPTIAHELADVDDTELILSGGVLCKASQAFHGPRAEASMEGYVFDKLFFDADGFDPDCGLSAHDGAQARLNARMVSHAREVILLADGGRIGRICLHHVCAAERVTTVVTDAGIAPAMLASLQRRQLRVVVAPAR
jgi:DeoR/GlpR family transcriptional regulator of sugar metabolism